MTDGTFIVETFNGIVRQTAISKMLCIRFFFDQTKYVDRMGKRILTLTDVVNITN